MVYALNLCLKSNFKRSAKDLDLSEHISFPIFEWRDEQNDSYWTLITNNSSQEESLVGSDLFANEPSYSKYHLVPEYKDADYLLKIEHDDDSLEARTVKQLQTIPKVITAYQPNFLKMPRKKKTKIVATLGPATSKKEVLKKMMKAGVDVFRINFSHADYDMKT